MTVSFNRLFRNIGVVRHSTIRDEYAGAIGAYWACQGDVHSNVYITSITLYLLDI